ncbi:rRNA-processing protein las1 [Microsporum audouinii]
MARPRVTPWKDFSQLVSVRDQFYLKTADGEDCRAKACSLVWVWKARGNLPHAIEATALLTDAILHDDPEKNSIFSIRAAYSLAFCRFVTGLVDSKLHGRKQSMYQKAMAVGIPASFVELRHEATHRDLPSLVVLRDAARRSMEWLWEFYWAKIEDDHSYLYKPSPDATRENIEEAGVLDLLGVVRKTLKPLADQINKPEKGNRASIRTKQGLEIEENSIRQLIALCRRESEAGALLAEMLLDSDTGILVSCVKRYKEGDEFPPSFDAWDEVLRRLCQSHPPLVTALVEEMASIIVSADTRCSNNGKRQIFRGPDDDSYVDDVFSWLEHILTAQVWAGICYRYLVLSHIEASCSAPGTTAGYWAKQIHDLLRHQITPASEKMKIDRLKPSAVPDTSTDPDSDIAVLRGYGWDFGQQITYKPIGTV